MSRARTASACRRIAARARAGRRLARAHRSARGRRRSRARSPDLRIGLAAMQGLAMVTGGRGRRVGARCAGRRRSAADAGVAHRAVDGCATRRGVRRRCSSPRCAAPTPGSPRWPNTFGVARCRWRAHLGVPHGARLHRRRVARDARSHRGGRRWRGHWRTPTAGAADRAARPATGAPGRPGRRTPCSRSTCGGPTRRSSATAASHERRRSSALAGPPISTRARDRDASFNNPTTREWMEARVAAPRGLLSLRDPDDAPVAGFCAFWKVVDQDAHQQSGRSP